MLYIALVTPESDVFYQNTDSPDWNLLNTVYTLHEFPDNHRLVKAYLGFYDYIALANAVASRHDEKTHQIANYIKQGLYGA